ncbi:MAG: glutamine synthetase family protein [Pseudomonadota bacterium]
MTDPATLQALRTAATEAAVHTIEIGTPDTQGHLRGKRVPVVRFFETVATSGVNVADAIFVFDMQNDLPDNAFINMDSGYLDCCLMPRLETARFLGHRPGYGLLFADALTPAGELHPLAPRTVLRRQIERCNALGMDPVVATELEFFLCTPDWQPVQNHIQYSSLTDAMNIETVLAEMRQALAAAGIEVESSNAEYGPGQFEINTGHADAMTAADNTVLFKSIVKQVAVQHGLRATFMPKPWAEQSGNGMHVHTSLVRDGVNLFADAGHEPNATMRHWLGGLLEHAAALSLLGMPNGNAPKRIAPYTFAPTHICWGLDNRTVLARCMVEPQAASNRVEFRSAGADANPHLMIAGLLAAGADGVERGVEPIPMSAGDMYTNPGAHTPIPTTLGDTIAAFEGSALADLMGEMFSQSFVSIANGELALAAEHAPEADAVNDWERARFLEHC